MVWDSSSPRVPVERVSAVANPIRTTSGFLLPVPKNSFAQGRASEFLSKTPWDSLLRGNPPWMPYFANVADRSRWSWHGVYSSVVTLEVHRRDICAHPTSKYWSGVISKIVDAVMRSPSDLMTMRQSHVRLHPNPQEGVRLCQVRTGFSLRLWGETFGCPSASAIVKLVSSVGANVPRQGGTMRPCNNPGYPRIAHGQKSRGEEQCDY